MEETLTSPEEVSNQRPETTLNHEQLAGSLFGVEAPRQETQLEQVETKPTEEAKVELPKQETKPPDEKDEILDANQWLKSKWGWESEELADAEIRELRALKEKTPQEIKFANDLSKQVHELLREGKVDDVIDIYSKQKQLDKVVNGEVNPQTSEEIIKLQMKLKHPKLTDAQIDFQFNEDYGVGRKPAMKDGELQEEYDERLAEYNERVERVNMKKTIAATMAIPELQKLKSEIVFPDIPQSQVQKKQLTQEELDAARKYEESYVQSVDASLRDFSGFSVKVKSEAAGLPETAVNYSVIDAEKNSLGQSMKDFAKANYDANALFAQRWVSEGGVLNTKQMIEDRYLLDNRDKIFQKIADETATKVFEAYIKGKKNIDVTQTQQGGIVTELKKPEGGTDGFDTIRDNIFGKTG